jgi:pimeloyl-ACP methyl ester carboxylesterase
VPIASNRGVSLHYEVDGEGDPVVFVSDFGCGGWLWAWQAPAIAGPYRSIVYDNRGTRRSDAPPGPYSIDVMAADLEAVLADAGVRSATVVGAGMGGTIALEYALEYTRAEKLVLLGTAASGDSFETGAMAAGPDEVDALLSPEFREAYPEEVERIVGWRREEDADGAALDAHVAAVEAFDASDRLYEVTQPALVLHGGDDSVVPPTAGEALAEGLPRGEFRVFEAGTHLFFVEQSRLVTDALVGFLEDQKP